MSQSARILVLYQRLMAGKVINKAQLALEFETTERSIDRDILAIRLFLSDSFSGLDLVYDRKLRGYKLKNLRIKQDIGIGECYLLTKLLLGNQAVRSDEQERTVNNLLSQLSGQQRNRVMQVLRHAQAAPVSTKTTSLQLVEDLLYSIEQRDRILIHFGTGFLDALCVPYSVEFCECEAYLVAMELEENLPRLYALSSIHSYRPTRQPYILSQAELAALRELAEYVYEGTEEKRIPFVYSPKKESECES